LAFHHAIAGGCTREVNRTRSAEMRGFLLIIMMCAPMSMPLEIRQIGPFEDARRLERRQLRS
jgi:hypothetical protein